MTTTNNPGPAGYQGSYGGASNAPRQMRRSHNDRIISGVAGGLGEYFGVDAVIFRVLFAVLSFFGGVGLLAYAMAWLLLPEPDVSASALDKAIYHLRRRRIPAWLVIVSGALVLWLVWFSWWMPGPTFPAVVLLIVVALVLVHRLGSKASTSPAPPLVWPPVWAAGPPAGPPAGAPTAPYPPAGYPSTAPPPAAPPAAAPPAGYPSTAAPPAAPPAAAPPAAPPAAVPPAVTGASQPTAAIPALVARPPVSNLLWVDSEPAGPAMAEPAETVQPASDPANTEQPEMVEHDSVEPEAETAEPDTAEQRLAETASGAEEPATVETDSTEPKTEPPGVTVPYDPFASFRSQPEPATGYGPFGSQPETTAPYDPSGTQPGAAYPGYQGYQGYEGHRTDAPAPPTVTAPLIAPLSDTRRSMQAWISETSAAHRLRVGRRRPIKLGVALSLIAGWGAVALSDAFTRVPFPAYLWVGLAILVTGLVVSLVTDRMTLSLLLPIALLATVAVVLGGTRASLGDGSGQIGWMPNNASQLVDHRQFAGQSTMNLNALPALDAPKSIKITQAAGEVWIKIPRGLNATVISNIHMGDVQNGTSRQTGQYVSGLNVHLELGPPAGTTGQPLTIYVNLTAGHVQVDRAS